MKILRSRCQMITSGEAMSNHNGGGLAHYSSRGRGAAAVMVNKTATHVFYLSCLAP